MIENRKGLDGLSHLVLIAGMVLVAFPLYLMLITASYDANSALPTPVPLLPGGHFFANLGQVLTGEGGAVSWPFWKILGNSLAMAVSIALGKMLISLLSAFAIVYFRFPLRNAGFVLIFATLMLPVEVRIFPTVAVITDLGMINSFAGLTLPLIASATSTFLLRQSLLSLPRELAEAARVDGAGPLRFLWDIVLPVIRTTLAALFVINFVYGWNQYLWPLLVLRDASLSTTLMAIKSMMGEGAVKWPLVMAGATLTLLPPLLVVLGMQRWFVKGLVDSEK